MGGAKWEEQRRYFIFSLIITLHTIITTLLRFSLANVQIRGATTGGAGGAMPPSHQGGICRGFGGFDPLANVSTLPSYL